MHSSASAHCPEDVCPLSRPGLPGVQLHACAPPDAGRDLRQRSPPSCRRHAYKQPTNLPPRHRQTQPGTHPINQRRAGQGSPCAGGCASQQRWGLGRPARHICGLGRQQARPVQPRPQPAPGQPCHQETGAPYAQPQPGRQLPRPQVCSRAQGFEFRVYAVQPSNEMSRLSSLPLGNAVTRSFSCSTPAWETASQTAGQLQGPVIRSRRPASGLGDHRLQDSFRAR